MIPEGLIEVPPNGTLVARAAVLSVTTVSVALSSEGSVTNAYFPLPRRSRWLRRPIQDEAVKITTMNHRAFFHVNLLGGTRMEVGTVESDPEVAREKVERWRLAFVEALSRGDTP